MPTPNIWLGTSLANNKVVTISPGANIANIVPPPSITIGLGAAAFTFTGWNAQTIADTWNASQDTFVSTITASVSGSSVVFTASEAGEDFEITCTQGGVVAHSSSTYQTITFNPLPSGGTFTLTVAGQTTGAITYSAVAATLAASMSTAIAGLSGFSAGDVTVTAQTAVGVFLFDFSTGRFVGTSVAPITATHTSLTGGNASVSITTLSDGNAGTNEVVNLSFPINGTHTENINEIQSLSTAALGGTFTLSLSGYGTTVPLPYTAGRSLIQSALEAIVGLGNVKVTGGPLLYTDGVYRTVTLEYIGSLSGVNMPLMTVSASSSSLNERQRIRMTNNPGSGTFTLTFGANTTGALAYNATAAQIQTALTGLASIGVGNLVATGGPLSPGGSPTTATTYPTKALTVSNAGQSIDYNNFFLYAQPQSFGILKETMIQFAPTDFITQQLLNLRGAPGSPPYAVTISIADVDNADIPASMAAYTALAFTGSVTTVVQTTVSTHIENIAVDITSLVQTVKARPGWVDGNQMVIRITTTNAFTYYGPTHQQVDATSVVPFFTTTSVPGTFAPIDVTFQGSLAGADQPLITTTPSGAIPVITSLQDGGAGSYTVNLVQDGGSASVANISGGTFSLQVITPTQTVIVGPMDYNISAANLVLAFTAAFGSTVCSATGGPAPGTAIVITFLNALAKLPIRVNFLNSLITNQAGSVRKSTVTSGIVPAVGSNSWDLIVCPGAGTLGINQDATYARIELTITNNLAALSASASQRPIGTIYLPLYNLDADRIQYAINEALGCDACRVVRVGRSQEWANIKVPADPTGAYGGGYQAANTSIWYMKDTYRVVFVNQFAPSGTTSLSATFPLIAGIPAAPSTFMANSGSILSPTTSDAVDLFPETNRVVIGIILMEATTTPLHMVSVLPSVITPQSSVAWRVKLLTQYPQFSTAGTGIADYVSQGKITFSWVTKVVSDTGVVSIGTTLASTPAMDWNSTASIIQLELSRMAQGLFGSNIRVTGSLYGSWLSESSKDAPLLAYQDLQIQLVNQFLHLPIDEFGYDLICTISSPQFPTPSVFQKNFSVLMELSSKTLPPRVNQRERITVSSPSALASISFGVNNLLFTVPPTATALDIQTLFDQSFGAGLAAYLPEKLAHPVVVYGTNLTEGPMEFEFSSYGLGQSTTPTLWVSSLPLTGVIGLVTITTQGVGLSDENQLVQILGAPYGGTFTLSWSGNTTAAMAYNISLTAFIAALAAATPSAISLTGVTGDVNQGFTLNWAAAGGNRAQATAASTLHNGTIVGDTAVITNIGGLASVFTVTETVKGRGPSYWDDKYNWSLRRVPNSADVVSVDDSPSPIKYGIDQSCTFSVEALIAGPALFSLNRRRQVFDEGQTVQFVLSAGGTAPTGLTPGTVYVIKSASATGTFRLQTTAGADVVVTTAGSGTFTLVMALTSLSVYNRFTGSQIGLPHVRNSLDSALAMVEYLPCYLKGYITTLDVGVDEGSGLVLGRFNVLDGTSSIIIENTGDSTETSIPAVLLLCNNAATSINIDNGTVGLALYSDETAVCGTITIRDGNFTANACTIGSIARRQNAPAPRLIGCTVASQVNI